MKTLRKKTKQYLIFTLIALLFVSIIVIVTIVITYAERIDTKSSGRIIFLEPSEMNGAVDLMVTDGEGNRVQMLSSVAGSPAWSIDGKWIAVGCRDHKNLCLISSSSIQDLYHFPIKLSFPDSFKKEIPLPSTCVKKKVYDPARSIRSISWSRDGTKLAIVCGDYPDTDVCIETLDGSSHCWPKIVGHEDIVRAAWSPVEDVLAVSGKDYGTGIFLTDPDGKVIKYVRNGWSAAWSPDGKQLAFFDQNSERQYVGIGKVNNDGSNSEWLYLPPARGSNADEQALRINSSCIDITGAPCRIAWSPDGKYIAFSSYYGNEGYDSQIFRLDVKTKEIIFITNHLDTHYSEPDWGQ